MLSHVLPAAVWTLTHQAPLSLGFCRREYWSGLPRPPPGDLPDLWIKSMSPALASGFFITSALGGPEDDIIKGKSKTLIQQDWLLEDRVYSHSLIP